VLLGAGADVALSMHKNGWEPLIVAAWSGHSAVVSLLLAAGANRDVASKGDFAGVAAGSTVLSVAETKGYHTVVELLSKLSS